MRLVLAPKVAVVEVDTAVAGVEKVVAEEDEGVADENQFKRQYQTVPI
jgi:hypothetical protein